MLFKPLFLCSFHNTVQLRRLFGYISTLVLELATNSQVRMFHVRFYVTLLQPLSVSFFLQAGE